MAELGIVDIRGINNFIKSLYNYDFSSYALTAYKQRLERLMKIYIIDSAEGLTRKLQNDPNFFDIFLYEMSIPSTEMFRDPSLWRWLREDYFPGHIDKASGKLKIWFPLCVSGAELYSLTILLAELDITDKVQIIATTISDKCLTVIKEGTYDLKKIEVSEENYKRFNGQKELSAYYKTERDNIVRNTALIKDVDFRKTNINFDNAPYSVNLILFRNNLIYYNPTHQDIILQVMYRALSPSGHLVIGIREKITGISASRDFESANDTESVYRKKF
jgi:chemotaxis protein methyltransferase CheR